ncbi:MAG: DUF559 domain-containing protein [Phycisphaerales bacterium]|nr:DUF559 domain-containing protein [Phycisphaerales bacterium]
MPDLVRITDVSPRDGLQNEPGIIPTPDKVRLIELLCHTGVDEIEVTSFVSPKWVPQLGDASELVRLLSSLPLPEGGGRGVGSASIESQRWRPPPRSRQTVGQAQALRRNMTGPEWTLWTYLRQREAVGLKFRRQHPIGSYILDFFCQEKLLAIEIDGITHAGTAAKQHDATRDAYMHSLGIETIRVTNNSVIANPLAVAEWIVEQARARDSRGSRTGWRGRGRAEPTPLPPPSGRGSARPIFSALVPNDRGMQSALDANQASRRHVIEKVSVFTAASETFSHKNTNATIAETIDRFRPVIESAHTHSLKVRGYVSCVIACPFEGPIDPNKVAEVSRALAEIGVDELDLGDTIGAGNRESTTAMLRAVDRIAPITHGRVPITLHLHDTFGRAAECVHAALDLGVRSFDGSVAGLGGCPYASKKLPDGTIQRAPGNISTELLVQTIHDAGYRTNVNLDKLREAAEFAREIVARSRAASSSSSSGGPPA